VHHDVGQVSLSLKLNSGYEGGVLTFPRQGFDNTGMGVGEAVVWPSLVTHPHQAGAVTRGVKYGLTIWCSIPGVAG
jgi:predicted 2-oxoglutarate/Fe(II)-dependent dioxygenase YbiX